MTKSIARSPAFRPLLPTETPCGKGPRPGRTPSPPSVRGGLDAGLVQTGRGVWWMRPGAICPRTALSRTALALLLVTGLWACGPSAEERAVKNREVTVACGRCIFEMEEAQALGCPWAVEIDGKHYIIQGHVPEDHQSHAPDGICNMPRRAVVDGRIRGDRFILDRLDLKPPENVPSSPRFTPEDIH